MESIILNIVQGYLKDYVNNFRKEQVSLNFLRGQGELRDLDINVDAINDLVFGASPGLRFTRILCNTLAIRSPDVWSLKNKPITFFIDRLFIEVAEIVDIVAKSRPPASSVPKKAASAKYGFIDRVIDCLSFEVNQITVAFRTIGRVKTAAVGCWTPPVVVAEFGRARLYCTNHNGVEAELNECIRVRNTRRPLLFLYKQLNVERASMYVVNPEVWDRVADQLIGGMPSGGILGLNRTLPKGSRGYVSMRILHDIPLKMELCMRKRMDNNLLLGLEIAFVVDIIKLTIKPQQLSELLHFVLGMYYCLFRLDVVVEMFGPDPHGEGFTAAGSTQLQHPKHPGVGGVSPSPSMASGSGRGRRNEFGREELANLDRLDAEINTSGSTVADFEGDERADDWQRSSLNSDEDPPHLRSVMVIQVNEVILSLPMADDDEAATATTGRSRDNSESNSNSNRNHTNNNSNNNHGRNTINNSNTNGRARPSHRPSVAVAHLSGLVHTTIWPEHAGLTESIGQMTLKSFRLSEHRGVQKECLLWSKEPLDVGGRPIFITPLPRGVKEQSVCDLETLPGTSFVW